jgi:glycosyltransferase involved in cell wall biosynthesis
MFESDKLSPKTTSPSRLKITFVHTSSILNLRGSEIWLLDVCSLLQKLSFSTVIANFDLDEHFERTGAEYVRREGMLNRMMGKTVLLRLHSLRLRPVLVRLPFGKKISQLIDRNFDFVPLSLKFLVTLRKSDVVYFVQCQHRPVHLLFVLAASILAGRKPVIDGVHVSPRVESHHAALLRLFARVGVLRSIHSVNREFAIQMQHQIGCPSMYVPNGIFLEEFETNTDSKFGQKFFTMLFVGAMNRAKGADMLPGIHDALQRLDVPFSLVICTSGGELAGRVVSWSKGKSNVILRGFLDRKDLAKLYADSSVVIFPSRQESWGLACLEAQASGTPVVVSDTTGFRQTVINGRTGFFAWRLDPEGFAGEIAKIYALWETDRRSYLDMCRSAQANVRDNFQWKHVQKELVGLFDSASI